MRLFLAIELPDPVRQKLAGLSRAWQENWNEELLGLAGDPYPKASWVRPENLHVTVKFLGDVADQEVSKLCTQLAAVRVPEPISLWPDRIECLPPGGPVRIISAGLMGDLDAVGELHRQIEKECEAVGFPCERRKFRPHVTLARLREWLPSHTRKNLADASLGHLPAPKFTASEFVLMQSELHPQGSRYLALARFPIGC